MNYTSGESINTRLTKRRDGSWFAGMGRPRVEVFDATCSLPLDCWAAFGCRRA